jgi:FtsZ-interacting cell division protein ZipA
MSTFVAIIVIVLAIVLVAGFAVAMKRRKEQKLEARRQEARDTRAYADVAQLEADRQSAEAVERAARAEHERLAAQQQEMAASAQRSTVQDLHARADDIDPDL